LVPADTRTLAQRQTLELFVRELHQLYPNAKIVGHRDLSPDLNKDGVISPNEWTKMCPCFDVKSEYAGVMK
jgi:N-acetyl-anhydromuramyl-L-alanine amidase AmpD